MPASSPGSAERGDYAARYEAFMRRVTGRTPDLDRIGDPGGLRFKGAPRSPTPRRAAAPAPQAPAAPSAREADLRRWSKDQLYARAKDLGVAGRSRMTKETLVLAILEREGGSEPSAA